MQATDGRTLDEEGPASHIHFTAVLLFKKKEIQTRALCLGLSDMQLLEDALANTHMHNTKQNQSFCRNSEDRQAYLAFAAAKGKKEKQREEDHQKGGTESHSKGSKSSIHTETERPCQQRS